MQVLVAFTYTMDSSFIAVRPFRQFLHMQRHDNDAHPPGLPLRYLSSTHSPMDRNFNLTAFLTILQEYVLPSALDAGNAYCKPNVEDPSVIDPNTITVPLHPESKQSIVHVKRQAAGLPPVCYNSCLVSIAGPVSRIRVETRKISADCLPLQDTVSKGQLVWKLNDSPFPVRDL
jgi:hypothetical protein